MNLAIKCVVSNPDGSLLKREENEWGGLDQEAVDSMKAKLLAFADRAKKAQGGGEDSASLSAVFSGSVDGVAVDPITISNVSLKAHFKLEREWDREREALDRDFDKALKKAAK